MADPLTAHKQAAGPVAGYDADIRDAAPAVAEIADPSGWWGIRTRIPATLTAGYSSHPAAPAHQARPEMLLGWDVTHNGG